MSAGPTTFHAHLDACRQCREHPMALCPTGASLLQQAADALPHFRVADRPAPSLDGAP